MLMSIPSVTRALIIINVVVFLSQSMLGNVLLYMALWPLGGGSPFFPWQVVTYGFLHTGITHLLINMLAIYMFGGDGDRGAGERLDRSRR